MPDSSDNVNSGARASAVDFSRPIEANDGSAATYTGQSEAGYYRVKWSDRDGDSRDHWFDENGKSNVQPSSLWMRNVQPTTPELDPALWDRMVALVRRLVDDAPRSSHQDKLWAEARAIVADLPKPVDPDEAIARDLAATIAENAPAFELHDLEMAALEGLRRGRELSRQGDAA